MTLFDGINFGRLKPSFMIIGVQKGGTSSLHHYLTQHPKLVAPKIKELHYFDTSAATTPKEYKKLFPRFYASRKMSFEATPRYIYYPGTAKKIADFDPKMKFIVLLRDPVGRAYSAWNMYRQMASRPLLLEDFKRYEQNNPLDRVYSFFYSNKFPSFSDWVKFEIEGDFPKDVLEPSIVRRGYYKEQIETYFRFFPKASFLFLSFEDFQEEILFNLDKIADFLGISGFKNLDLDLKAVNKRIYINSLDDKTAQYLAEHFLTKNEGLEALVGLNLRWMKK